MRNRKLWDYNAQSSKKVNEEICQVVVGVVSAKEKKKDWDTQKELLGRSVLITVVDLLPHVEIVIGTSIEFERDSPYPMKHKERYKHISDIG